MRHWWESHFGLLWKHFFERVLLPLTGLQKCNQQSYVLARRVVVLWSMRSNSSILQFPKQKVGKGKTNSRKRFFDEWILTHLFCWRSFHHERISQVVFFTEQISQYTIQLGSVASSILVVSLLYAEGKSCHGEKCFQFLKFVCFCCFVFVRCWRGLVMHWFQSTSKTFFQVLLLWQICAEFFKTNLGHKISLIPVIISAKK